MLALVRLTIRRLLDLTPAVRSKLIVLVVVLLGVTATYVGQAILIALMLALIFSGQGLGSILLPLAAALVLLGARAGLLVWREKVAISAAGVVKKALRQQLVDKLFALGPGWLQRTRVGSVQSTVVDGVEAVDPCIGRLLPQAVATLVGAAAITAYVLVLDPLVGGIVLACAAATPLVPAVSDRLMKGTIDRWWRSYRGLYSDNLDALQGMATLKSFNASRRRGLTLDSRAQEFCADSIRVMAYWGAYLGAVGLATAGWSRRRNSRDDRDHVRTRCAGHVAGPPVAPVAAAVRSPALPHRRVDRGRHPLPACVARLGWDGRVAGRQGGDGSESGRPAGWARPARRVGRASRGDALAGHLPRARRGLPHAGRRARPALRRLRAPRPGLPDAAPVRGSRRYRDGRRGAAGAVLRTHGQSVGRRGHRARRDPGPTGRRQPGTRSGWTTPGSTC